MLPVNHFLFCYQLLFLLAKDVSASKVDSCCEYFILAHTYPNRTCKPNLAHSYGKERNENLACAQDGKSFSDKALQRLILGNTSHLHKDGKLQISPTVLVGFENFCIDGEDGTGVLVCPPDCSSSSTPCIKKCCGWDEYFSSEPTLSCIVDDTSEMFLRADNFRSVSNYWKDQKHFEGTTFVTGGVQCPQTVHTRKFKLLQGGNVKIEQEIGSWLEIENYCLEKTVTRDGGITTENLVALYCSSEAFDKTRTYYTLQMWLSFVSWIALLITLAVYLVLWKTHSIQGWMQFSFIISVFFYYFVRFFRRLIELKQEFMVTSIIPEILDNFFSMAFLMNLVNLSVHMFWTFLKLTPSTRRVLDLRRLYISCAICWGISVLVLIPHAICYGYACLPLIAILDKFIQAIILTTNLIFGVMTVIVIWKHKRDVRMASSTDFKKMLEISLRVFFLTGLIWTLKILEIFAKTAAFDRNAFWDAVQVLTYSYGLVLFAVIVLNKRILGQLQLKFVELSGWSDSKVSRDMQTEESENAQQITELHSLTNTKDSD